MRRRELLCQAMASAALIGGVARPSAAQGRSRRFRLGHNNTTTSIAHVCANAFAKALAERSGGRLSIQIFPNALLGSEMQMLKSVADGTLDMSVPPTAVFPEYSVETTLIELPYLFADAAAARRALDGRLGSHCAEQLKARGMVILAWGEIGIRQITANRAIEAPADLEGLKLRVSYSLPIKESFAALGARPGILDFAHLVEGLRTGTFEAQENPIHVVFDQKLYTVQNYLSLTRHAYTPMPLVISRGVFEELPAADRELLTTCAGIGAVASRRHAERMDADDLAGLRKTGMFVTDRVDQSAFRAAMGGIEDRLAGLFGADSLTTVRRLAARS